MADYNVITCVKCVGDKLELPELETLLDYLIRKFHVNGELVVKDVSAKAHFIRVYTNDDDRPEPTAQGIKDHLGEQWNVSLTGYAMVLHMGSVE